MSAPAGAAQQTEMLDRVLAVVDGGIITLSDVRSALKFGLVPADVSTDPIQAGLRRLIERRLMLAEVERYAPPEPTEAAINAAYAALRARFKGAEGFDAALKQSSTSVEEMRRYIRDSLRLDTYIQQRFATPAEPSEEDLVRYYKEHTSEFSRDGVVPPLSEVRQQVRGQLLEQRRSEAVSEWVAGLRRRGSVIELPQVSR